MRDPQNKNKSPKYETLMLTTQCKISNKILTFIMYIPHFGQIWVNDMFQK